MKHPRDPVVQVNGLKKQFGAVRALNGLDLTVFRGDIYGLIGPNGSGKSTTIRILLSLVNPDSGTVRIFGLEMTSSKYKVLAMMGALIERPAFYEDFSAEINLSLLLQYAGLAADKNRIYESLDLVGLKGREKDKVRKYSEGMKQRLGIAQALIHNPQLLILDEPFSNLDPSGVKDIRDLLIKLNRESGTTIIISSHNLDEMEKLVNRMILLKEGVALREGSKHKVLAEGLMAARLETDDPEKTLAVLENSNFQIDGLSARDELIFMSVHKDHLPGINAYLVGKGIRVFNLSTDLSLESYFLSLMREK